MPSTTMKRRPIDVSIESGPRNPKQGEAVDPDRFREALAHWASGVCIVATRDPDDQQVYATTVSSLGGVSADPPRIMFSLGPGAQVLPFLPEGRRFAVSVLSGRHGRLASDFADSLPIGPSPFPEDGDPVISDALARLVCTVQHVFPVDASRIVVGLVVEAEVEDDGGPLVNYRRDYHTLD